MCLWTGQKGTPIEGLLGNIEDMPLPLPKDGENFPGDVLVGWKDMMINDKGTLVSAVYGVEWQPDRPMAANQRRGGAGIYPQWNDNFFATSDTAIYAFSSYKRWKFTGQPRARPFVKVALWGRAIDFERDKRSGCMAEFAYPLEVHQSFSPDTYNYVGRRRRFDMAVEKYGRRFDMAVEKYGPMGVLFYDHTDDTGGTFDPDAGTIVRPFPANATQPVTVVR